MKTLKLNTDHLVYLVAAIAITGLAIYVYLAVTGQLHTNVSI